MRRTLFTIALCAVMAVGCGGATGKFVQKGIDRYDRADYTGAMNEFSGVSGTEQKLNQKALVRYLVYRGLSEYHLGQRSDAQADLTRGKEAYSRGSASWLAPEIVAEMDSALTALNPPPAATPAAAPTDTATAATPPPPATGEALVPVKSAAPAKSAAASAPPVKTATASAPPAKTSSPPTKTLSSSQSTSPK